MKQVFADTLYWVASITPGDSWYAPTLQAVAALGPVDLVTTEEVLSGQPLTTIHKWGCAAAPALWCARRCQEGTPMPERAG
jgi:hypothetical protein